MPVCVAPKMCFELKLNRLGIKQIKAFVRFLILAVFFTLKTLAIFCPLEDATYSMK